MKPKTPARASGGNDGASAGLHARQIAAEILMMVEHRGGYADALLGARLPALELPDRRLATRLVLGTIAWQARLDYELERLCKRDLAGIQPEAVTIMRMGLLQLRFLDRIPHHAAVSTSVELAKRSRGAKAAAGFINAVMRRATRETIALPARTADEIRWLAIMYSHPRWMVERFVEWFGREDAERLMAANNEAAPNVLRLNLARASRAEIVAKLEADGMEIASEGRAAETVILKGAPRFDGESYRAGLFQAQSEASQLVTRMLAPARGATVVDCAAAPGAKSAHLAELVGSPGRVIAVDLNLAGLKSARGVCRQLHHRNVDFIRADAFAALPMRERRFEYVLLDAPCTGLGTLREHPEIRWRLGPDDPSRIAKLQLQMLRNAAAIVQPGGAIVYSVCSLAPEEGEAVIREFLRAQPEFEIDAHAPNCDDLLGADGVMRTRPDRGSLDGFFAARLKRKS
ncbi:MAG TPA: 16S rRNA (cytosine(967)-C(5))-methyltransferase RsmB [Candidatus Binataceae bacterium]|nr:16S rRNA (cytosine(967)-C(5))-methyltransferase RsmB [Candidatus Binataceae bacterium]